MYEEMREKVILEPIATKPSNRIDNPADLNAYIQGLQDYLSKRGYLSKGKKELTASTEKTWINGVWNIFRIVGYVEFSDAFVRDARKALENYRKRNGEPLTVATRITYLTSLEQFLRANWDRSYTIIKPDPGQVSYTDAKRFFTVDKIKRLSRIEIDDVFSVRDLSLLNYAYHTACRNGEICNAWIKDYDEVHGVITVQSHPAHGDYPAFSTKRGKTRQIHLSTKPKAFLDAWLKVRKDKGIAPDSPFIFLTATMEPFTHQTLNQVVGRHCDRIGLHGYPHKLRKSRIWHLLNIYGWPITVVQDIAGHDSIETTRRYCRSDVEEQRLWLKKTEKDDV